MFSQFNIARFYITGGGVNPDPLIFCHFADGLIQTAEDLSYDQATNLMGLRNTLEAALDEFNEMNAVMNLVLFDDGSHLKTVNFKLFNNT